MTVSCAWIAVNNVSDIVLYNYFFEKSPSSYKAFPFSVSSHWKSINVPGSRGQWVNTVAVPAWIIEIWSWVLTISHLLILPFQFHLCYSALMICPTPPSSKVRESSEKESRAIGFPQKIIRSICIAWVQKGMSRLIFSQGRHLRSPPTPLFQWSDITCYISDDSLDTSNFISLLDDILLDGGQKPLLSDDQRLRDCY